MGLMLAFGERGGGPLRVARLLFQLGLQRGVLSRQGGDLGQEVTDPCFQRGEIGEQLGEERQQGLSAQLCEFLKGRHNADL